MSFFKMTLYLSFILIASSVMAEPDLTEQSEQSKEIPPFSFNADLAVTSRWIRNQERAFKKTKARLKKNARTLQKEEKAQEKKIDRLKDSKITKALLEESTQKRQAANNQMEKSRLEREKVQNILDERLNYLKQIEAQIKILKEMPSAESTKEQQQERATLEKELKLQQQAIEVEQQQIEILNTQFEQAVQRVVLALDWHIQLETRYYERSLAERNQVMVEAKAALEEQQKQLQKEQEDLPNKIESLEATKEEVKILEKMLDKAGLDKSAAEVEINNLKLEYQSTETNLEGQKQYHETEENRLEELKKMTVEEQLKSLQEKRIFEREKHLQRQNKALELEEEQLKITQSRINLTEKRLEILIQWYEKLQEIYEVRQKEELKLKMQQDQQNYLSQAVQLRWQLDKTPNSEEYSAQRYLLQTQIQEANERAQYVVRQLEIGYIEDQLKQWRKIAGEPPPAEFSPNWLENLRSQMQELNELLAKLKTLHELLQEKLAVLEKQQEVVNSRAKILSGQPLTHNKQAQAVLAKLEKIYKNELTKIPFLQVRGGELLADLEKAYKENMTKALLRQRNLPTNTDEWQNLLQEISTIPHLFWQQLQLTGRGLMQASQQTNVQGWLILSIAALIWLGFIRGIIVGFSRISQVPNVEGRSFIVRVLLFGLRFLQLNTWSLAVTGVFLLFIWQTKPNLSSIAIALLLFFVWLGTKLLISLSGLLLSELNLKPENRVKIKWLLTWVIIFTGLLTLITMLAHVEIENYALKVSLTLRDLIDSFFMLLLSLTILPLFYIRKIILNALTRQNISSYWLLVVNLLTLLLPLSILIVSILGVIGYISLGWTVAKQLSFFLLVLTGWLIAQGFEIDIIQLLKNLVSKDSRFYELWTEDLIPLVQKLLSIIVFILAVGFLFWLNGWHSDVAVKDNIAKVLNYPLMNLTDGTQLRVLNIVLSIFIVWAVFWLASWSNKLSYRWIFSNISDAGIRHSLSVFIQYLVVVLGLFIALKVIGIQPAALTVFAGAVGIGLGFGLQNITANFISGILLLIERPMRTGDMIEVGGSSGIVTQIGIRSTTIKTSDNTEILIPNADLVSQSVVNWTRNNKVIRTTLQVHISYNDDVQLAENIIKDILTEVPGILTDPDHQVNLWELSSSSMVFRIDYFVDWQTASSSNVKAMVLSKIWSRFKLVGIKPNHKINLDFSQKDKLLTGALKR